MCIVKCGCGNVRFLAAFFHELIPSGKNVRKVPWIVTHRSIFFQLGLPTVTWAIVFLIDMFGDSKLKSTTTIQKMLSDWSHLTCLTLISPGKPSLASLTVLPFSWHPFRYAYEPPVISSMYYITCPTELLLFPPNLNRQLNLPNPHRCRPVTERDSISFSTDNKNTFERIIISAIEDWLLEEEMTLPLIKFCTETPLPVCQCDSVYFNVFSHIWAPVAQQKFT